MRTAGRHIAEVALLQLAIAALAVFSAGVMAQSQGLSRAQVEKLVSIHTPDDVIAEEIRSRGLDFKPSIELLAKLEKNGAGTKTLASIRERLPMGSLEIDAPPASEVVMDGANAGSTDSQGHLALSETPAGTHLLIVKKPGYKDGKYTVLVAAKEYKRFAAELTWAGGYLTVRAEPSSATIKVAGLGDYEGGVSELPCPPGTYNVEVGRAGMRPETRTVSIAAGQHAAIDVHLVVDPELLKSRILDGRAQLAGGNVARAIAIADEIIGIDPSNANARSLAAETYFQSGDLQRFSAAATEALSRGGSVVIDLMHEDGGYGKQLHPAVLTVTAKMIEYTPRSSGGVTCSYPQLTTGLENVQGVQVTKNSGTAEVLLQISFRNPSGGKPSILNLAEAGSRIERRKVTEKKGIIGIIVNADVVVSPSNVAQVLGAVADMIRQVVPRVN